MSVVDHHSMPSEPKPSNPHSIEVLNKEEFHTVYAEEYAVAESNGSPLSVIFIDLDAFKEINDVLGHDVGDVVIDDVNGLTRKVSSSLRVSRGEDVLSATHSTAKPLQEDIEHPMIDTIPAHPGGDEFAIICKTDTEGVKIVVERLRAVFADYLTSPESNRLRELGFGMSIGVATKDEKTEDSSDLLREADQNMYDDKLRNLRELTPEQRRYVESAAELLKLAGVRLRDVSKYLTLSELDKAGIKR